MHDATEEDLRKFLEAQTVDLKEELGTQRAKRARELAGRGLFSSSIQVTGGVSPLRDQLQAFILVQFENSGEWIGRKMSDVAVRTIFVEYARQWLQEFGQLNYVCTVPSIDKERSSLRQAAEKPLEQMRSQIEAHIAKYEAGVGAGKRNSAPMTVNVVHANTIVGGVQQAGASSKQNSAVTITTGEIEVALQRLEDALKDHADTALERAVTGDIATMRAQLTKAEPNSTILQEAGRSIRTVCEGALGGVLTNVAPAIPHAVSVLAATLGIG